MNSYEWYELATGIADPNGDMAFDHEEMPVSASLPGLQVVQLSS